MLHRIPIGSSAMREGKKSEVLNGTKNSSRASILGQEDRGKATEEKEENQRTAKVLFAGAVKL